MRELGPLIGLIVFIITTIVFGIFAFQTNARIDHYPDGTEGQTKAADQVRQLHEDLNAEKEKLRKVEAQIDQRTHDIRYQADRAEFNSRLIDEFELAHQFRLDQIKAGELFRDQGVAMGGKIAETKKDTMTKIRASQQEVRDNTEKALKQFSEARESYVARAGEEKKAFDKKSRELNQQTNYDRSVDDEEKRQLDILTQREIERADFSTDVDGHVILADAVNNTVVIDKGTADGVRNGFRFQCFALRAGNKRVVKAYIEVRKAESTLSECYVLTGKVDLPRDPLSDYVAKDPEEQFSPYQDSGKKGSTLQPLSAIPKTIHMGQNPTDPIVEGDLITNPFFSPGKTYTFYIAGSKDMVGDFQKSAIAYKWPQIKQVVESYGSKVVDKVELGVNYIIAQKNPYDDPDFSKAVTLGIPVIYEWELFRFLDQK